jgi:RNA polymerase sigma-70 factor (ECF subfamily)
MNTTTMLLAETRPFTKEDLIHIYEEQSPALYRYAVRLLGDSQLAEDCVAETFSRFLQAVRKGGGPNANVRAYLYRMAHNWITDHYRRNSDSTLPLEHDLKDGEMDSPSQIIIEEFEREQVRKALLKLPADQQQVIHFRFLEDWSHAEIAEVLGKSTEATRALQYRALNTLRQLLIGQDDEVRHD